ncbi:Vacuolar protein sorting-associated protein 74 [Malassezia restricta CBS 7877]|uniref:Vacuolar protein sorting-associated protein 74 n=1 Tax=Malassezia restricta (strain ATCC 96810 / NBRC 103918 / CBS 7877) TaxID=425264 RepID=A0A3G2SB85_MALR7|nr:Vacuolar protein sorting-associated protein 74 [Malassezia restricta CBS 7877]
MSSSGLLQRRRGTQDADDDADAPKRSGSTVSTVQKTSGSGSVSNIDLRTGHRLAYDPRDLTDEHEEQRYPRFTLMEEVLLLGLKDTQGYLSFWNDKLSFSLRGCILMELALRGRIRIASGAEQKRKDVSERHIELANPKLTADPLLDETIRHIQNSPPTSVAEWMDLLSGETWNMMRLHLQLKQVRERLCKCLVEKGVLRTEKRNFLLFDMPTHPIADMSVKDAIRRRVLAFTTAQSIHPDSLYKDNKSGRSICMPATRALCVVTAAHCGNVLENVLQHLSLGLQESATEHVEHLMDEFAQWPMAPSAYSGGIPPQGSMEAMAAASMRPPQLVSSSKKQRNKVGVSINDLVRIMCQEYEAGGTPSAYEVIAAVLSVFVQMDAIL